MFTIRVALAISLSLTSIPTQTRATSLNEPRVECGITTVGYRFIGTPGQEFSYAGDTYVIPQSRSIELIADASTTTYRAGGRELPLKVWPIDQFGFRAVQVQASQP